MTTFAKFAIGRRSSRPQLRWACHILAALLAGLVLRLFLVMRFPASAGDSAIYEELARNWITAHVYGLAHGQNLVPSDIRTPGYPAFLGLVYILLGRGTRAILLAQAVVDLGTCLLIARLAWLISPEPSRRRVGLAALWLAVSCPFLANYAAVPLSEVLATFLTAAALLPLAKGCVSSGSESPNERKFSGWNTWFAGGLLAGLGTLVRPETPLLLAALALVLLFHWRRRSDWHKLVRAGVLTGLGLILPLLPWAFRNWETLHEVQFLAPRYAVTPDEYNPAGFYDWTATWLVRYRDVYNVPWNVNSAPIEISAIPPGAFDSAAERSRVASLLDAYNSTLNMTPELDAQFAEIARERTARDPLRTYLWVPLDRAATLWFTPRVELLPVSGHIWPPGQRWHADPYDFLLTIGFGLLNFVYFGLALFGLVRFARRRNGEQGLLAIALLLVFVALRTAFLTTVETPEPRYVLECFPCVLAFAALAWLPRISGRRLREVPDGSLRAQSAGSVL